MSGLQLNVGLISGINYVELVDQLIRIDGIQRDNLQARTDRLAAERDALTNLMAVFLPASFMIRRLNNVTPFRMTEVFSSNENLIRATRTGSPVIGSYTFTPLQMASAQQTVAQGVASDTDALGKTGTITLGKGWSVETDNSIELKDLNGGLGVNKGYIRLIDGNGIRGTIDLRNAMTIKDVISAINDNHEVDVIAELDGDRIVLRDVSGGDPSKMMVQEVSGGTTAASLGLLGKDHNGNDIVNDNGVIRGGTIWRLGESMALSLLNDGNGLVFDEFLTDFTIYTRDGSRVSIDFFRREMDQERLDAGAPAVHREITVGDLLNTINTALDQNGVAGKVTARISDDGKGFVLEDNTVGNGFTSISQVGSTNPILRMFGLTETNPNSLGGTTATFFTDLYNRTGHANPLQMSFTDKAGNETIISLDQMEIGMLEFNTISAQTSTVRGAAFSAIADSFNAKLQAAGSNIELRVNSTFDGFDIYDKSDGTTHATTIKDVNFDLAARLGLTKTEAAATDLVSAMKDAEPGRLYLQDRAGASVQITITQGDLDAVTDNDSVVAMFNQKIAATPRISNTEPGTIQLTDRDGNTATINISQAELDAITNYDDVVALFNGKIAEFNLAHPGGEVQIEFSNQTGVDGQEYLVATDTSGGAGTFKIEQIGAADESQTITRFLGINTEAPAWSSDVIDAQHNALLTGIGMTFELSSAGDGIVVRDTTGKTDQDMVVSLAANRGIFTPQAPRYQLEVTLIDDIDTAAITAGEMTFQAGGYGYSTTVDIDNDDIADLAALQSAIDPDDPEAGMQAIADWFNDKIAAGVHGSTGRAQVSVQVNKAGTGLEIIDVSGSTTALMLIADNTGIFEVIRQVPNQELTLRSQESGDPGTIRIIDAKEVFADIVVTREEWEALHDDDDGNGGTLTPQEMLEKQVVFFNSKVAETNLQVEFRINGSGDRLVVVDTSGDGTGNIRVEANNSWNPPGNIPGQLGINHVAVGADTITGTAFGSVLNGDTVKSGTFETRNLLGGLDTVLLSSLNSGFGLAGIQGRTPSLPGAVEVQDRAGNKADLVFTYEDIKSMQTLTDAVKLYNAKLADAGVNLTVRINEQKTGLEVVDNTGSTSHNLIFRDKAEDYIIPAIPAIPAVPAVDGVSGGIGGSAAVSSGAGTAVLDFGNTPWLNGFTFGFTTDPSADPNGVYDQTTRSITFSLDEAALLAAADDEERNLMVKAAIDAQLAHHWSDIAADGNWATLYPHTHDQIQPPQLQGWYNLAASALNDATHGNTTTISTGGSEAGTAQLTFAETHWMNGFAFAFTTTDTPSYHFADYRFTFHLAQEILDETDPGERDRMVQEAINEQMVDLWENLPAFMREQDPPPVVLTAGMGTQAIYDAEHNLETRIAANVPGAQMGETYVPEVPEVPEEVIAGMIHPRIAANLGLNIDEASSRVNGGSLNRQVVTHTTLLSELNGGAGVIMANGRIEITDSQMVPNTDRDTMNERPLVPNTRTIIIDPERHRTVGDLINAINTLGLAVTATINTTGDGIMLEEYAGGTGSFSIYDVGFSRFAESLGIAGSVSAARADEDGRRRIQHTETHRIEIEATDSLTDVRDKINALNANYSASIVRDGSSAPYRLSVSSKSTGESGAFNIDLSALGLSTTTMTEAKDAKIAYGGANGMILSSSNNTFQGVVDGIDMTITGTSDSPVTISSESSSMDVKVTLQTFVENYNKYREELNKQMNFTVTSSGQIQVAEEGGYLWNSSVAKEFDREMSRILLRTIEGIPGVRSLADLGIKIRSNIDDIVSGGGSNMETGKLEFDEDKFQAAWDRDYEAVQKFFFDERTTTDNNGDATTVKTGFAQMFTDITDKLTGSADMAGSAPARIDTLSMTIDRNEQRIAFLEERLEWKRQMYLKQFYAMEQAMARMTSDMNAVSNIASSWSQNFSSGN